MSNRTIVKPSADRPRRWWFQQNGLDLRVGMVLRGRDGKPTGRITGLSLAGMEVAPLDGGDKRTFPREVVEGRVEEGVTQAQIAAHAAAQGYEWDPDIEEWLRIRDGAVTAVMKALRVPDGGGTWGWFAFDPDDGQQMMESPDCIFELNDEIRESAPLMPCPHHPLRCTAATHLATWAGGGWVLICPNNRRGSWDNARLAREALHPDSKPGVELHDGHQQARPGTKTVGWSMPSGGSKRGS